jgi:hypothetical protein
VCLCGGGGGGGGHGHVEFICFNSVNRAYSRMASMLLFTLYSTFPCGKLHNLCTNYCASFLGHKLTIYVITSHSTSSHVIVGNITVTLDGLV